MLNSAEADRKTNAITVEISKIRPNPYQPRQEMERAALSELEEKFKTVKGGKGIAYTVPMTSTIGVAIYQFLSNTTSGGLI